MLASALAVLAAPATLAESASKGPLTAKRPVTAGRLAPAAIQTKIHAYRKATWRWQAIMRRPRAPGAPYGRTAAVLRVWHRRASLTWRQAQRPPHRSAWLCIHRYEAAWNDPGAPYYGGLQMDWGFMRTYGYDLLRRKGTADRWTPLEQMWVAERALRAGRGFYPWPNAARICGLI